VLNASVAALYERRINLSDDHREPLPQKGSARIDLSPRRDAFGKIDVEPLFHFQGAEA